MAIAPLLLAVQAPATGPSMIVSIEQLSSALGTCRDQIGRADFAGEELASAGWPKVMNQGPDSAGYLMTTYRHPTTMLMVGLIHDPARSDTCWVVAPTGPEITPQSAQKLASTLFGKQRNGGWKIDAADVRQEYMAGGVRFAFIKKGAK